MKRVTKLFLFSLVLSATLAVAQANTKFQHVIIVVQENRTPDNLFGSDMFAQTRQLPGADLVGGGACENVPPKPPYAIALQSINLGNACDPNHGHKEAWISTYNGGAMDGACTITASGCTMTYSPQLNFQITVTFNPQTWSRISRLLRNTATPITEAVEKLAFRLEWAKFG